MSDITATFDLSVVEYRPELHGGYTPEDPEEAFSWAILDHVTGIFGQYAVNSIIDALEPHERARVDGYGLRVPEELRQAVAALGQAFVLAVAADITDHLDG